MNKSTIVKRVDTPRLATNLIVSVSNVESVSTSQVLYNELVSNKRMRSEVYCTERHFTICVLDRMIYYAPETYENEEIYSFVSRLIDIPKHSFNIVWRGTILRRSSSFLGLKMPKYPTITVVLKAIPKRVFIQGKNTHTEDLEEETLDYVLPNISHLEECIYAWQIFQPRGLVLVQVFEKLSDIVGTFPCRIISEMLGAYDKSDVDRVLNRIMSVETSSRRRKLQSKWTVLQGKVSTQSVTDIVSADSPYYVGVKIFEDVATLIYYMRRTKTLEDMGMAMSAFIRSVTGQSVAVLCGRLTLMMHEELVSYFLLQGSDSWCSRFTELFENYRTVKDSMFASKVLKVLNTTVFSVILHKMDIEPDGDLIKRIEVKKLRPSLLNCATFLDAMTDLVTFSLKQGRQYYLTGDFGVFFMDADSVSDWYVRAKKLEENHKFLANPDAVGLKIHLHLHDLHQAIEDGKSLTKYMKVSTPAFKLTISNLLRLESLNKEYLSICAAQSLRRQPLGVILYSKPGVGKSHLLEAIYSYHSKLRKLDDSPGYKFQFNSDEEYMTNFKSYMHCIVIDDVAQHHVDRVQGIDKSLGMCIKIVNNQPTCPPQAAIDDKGKTPVLSELVIATTNVKDMNIRHYFTKTYAVMRRFKIHIEIVLKGKFACKTGGISGEATELYEDKWDFIVREPVETSEMRGKFDNEITLTSFADLFNHIRPIIIKHHREQDLFLQNIQRFSNSELCSRCQLPTLICEKIGDCEINLALDETVNVQGTRHSRNSSDHEFSEEEETKDEEVRDADTYECFTPYIGQEAIDDDFQDVKAPWRIHNLDFVGNRRFLSEQMARAFVTYHTKNDPGNTSLERIASEYAYIHYPVMMRMGYPDEAILRDFALFLAWRYNVQDIERLSDTIVNLETGSWWRIKVSQFAMYMYMEYRAITYIVDWMLSFSLTGRLVVWIMGYVVRSQRSRIELMRRAGRNLDAFYGGTHPLVKILSLFSIVSIVGVYYKLYRRGTEYPPEEHMYTDSEAAIENWKKAEKKYKEEYDKEKRVMEERLDDIAHKMSVYKQATEQLTAYMQQLEEQKRVEDDKIDEVVKSDSVTKAQGLLMDFGTIPAIAPGDEKTNVWNNSESSVTNLDFCSDRATNMEAFQRSLNLSCVCVKIQWDEGSNTKVYEARALILSNDCILVNEHGVPDCSFKMTVLWSSIKGKICNTIEMFVNVAQVYKRKNRDLAVINTKALPPMVSNFTRNFARTSFDGKYDGFYEMRQADGSFVHHPVYGVHKTVYQNTVGTRFFNCVAFRGTVRNPTVDGCCGSPLIIITGYGPIVVGYHFLYVSCDRIVYASALFIEDFEHITTGVQGTVVDIKPYNLVKRNVSFLDFHEEGKLVYFGEIDYRVRYKTNVKPTEIKNQLIHSEPFGDFKFHDGYSKPLMHNYIPQQRALREYIDPSYGFDEVRLKKCADCIIKNILDNLPKSELELINISTYKVAVNGMPGMAYVDSMKRRTSMGFPWHETKRKHLVEMPTDEWPEGVRFTDDIEEIIEHCLAKYLKGERCHFVFSSNCKDEVVSAKKYAIGKTRVYFSCPAPYLVIMRMFFLGFSRVVQRNWKIFHCVIGVNCHSSQWQQVYDIISRFGTDRIIAGDFASFDKRFHMSFSRWVFYIIKSICMASGNFEGYEIVLEALGADFVNPTVNFFGMLIMLLCGEVSGHQITTPFNCLCALMYIMYSYGEFYDVMDFFEFVVILCMGDDHLLGVSVERPLFTHTSIKDVLDKLNVGYTMAEKEMESVPYINISNSTFLKRTFRYSTEMGIHVGPLERESLVKMLTYQVMSDTCSPSEQLAQTIVSASCEAFYHGKEFFEYFEDLINGLEISEALSVAMESYPRFSWEENVIRFLGAGNSASVPGRNQKDNDRDSYCKNCSHASLQNLRVDHDIKFTRAFPEIPIEERAGLMLKSEATGDGIESIYHPDNQGLAKTNEELNAHADEHPSTEGSVDTSQEQTTFVNEPMPEVNNLAVTGFDPTVDNSLITADISKFLSRPSMIWNYTWNIGSASGRLTGFDPWALFFNKSAIKSKLQTFTFVRCDLKLKFVINASPFYYGSIGAFYCPFKTEFQDGKMLSNVTSVNGNQILYSQRNHVWLDPQSVSTAEFTLPFLHYANFIRTQNLVNFTEMGTIDIVQYAGLKSANGVGAGGVTINCWAWAENVELAGGTVTAVLQGKSEYKVNGQVSMVASTVASASRALQRVPVLAPFAKATETVSDAIGSVASFFGFSNVPVIEDVRPVKSLAFHTLSSSQISEPIQKLSLQPKAETTVGQYFGDPGSDPLLISNFCARESFLGGTGWFTTAIENDILWTMGVQPDLEYYDTSSSAHGTWWGTPSSFVSHMFEYWSGDIIVRFKVIKSQYHRGRLNIAWDSGYTPWASQATVGDPSVMSVVLDLDEEDEIEVRIPYTQALPFLKLEGYTTTQRWSNGGAPVGPSTGNGVLQVRVINALTAPVGTSDVTILVFVRCAENIKFAAPRNLALDKSMSALQGRTIVFNNSTGPNDPRINQEVFGEHIASLRELMHRQAKVTTQIIDKTLTYAGDVQTWCCPIQRLPRPYGYTPYLAQGWELAQGLITPASNFPFHFTRPSLVNMVSNCFLGIRGSTNYTFNVCSDSAGNTQSINSVEFTRLNGWPSTGAKPFVRVKDFTTSTYSDYMRSLNGSNVTGGAGMALTNQRTQAGLSVNLPYYTNQKFMIMSINSLYYIDVENFNDDIWELSIRRGITKNTPDSNIYVDIYHGTGPDFDLVYFMNVPAVTGCPQPTAA